ncbi:MAG: hypothetical protein U0Q18_25275 [Bryobacteraceae bacterium]
MLKRSAILLLFLSFGLSAQVTFSPYSYGATPQQYFGDQTGVNDATQAFQRALWTMSTYGNPNYAGFTYIPPGNYFCNANGTISAATNAAPIVLTITTPGGQTFAQQGFFVGAMIQLSGNIPSAWLALTGLHIASINQGANTITLDNTVSPGVAYSGNGNLSVVLSFPGPSGRIVIEHGANLNGCTLPPGGPGTGLRIEDYRFLDTTFYGSVNAPYAANSGAPGFLQNSRSGYSTTLPSCHKYTIAPDSTGAFLTVSVDNSAVTTITGATNALPMVLTVGSTSGFYVGEPVTVSYVNPVAYDGFYTVLAVNNVAKTVTVSNMNSPGASYVSGGFLTYARQGIIGGLAANVSAATNANPIVYTVQSPTATGFYIGEQVLATGNSPAGYNGTGVVTATNGTTSISVAMTAAPGGAWSSATASLIQPLLANIIPLSSALPSPMTITLDMLPPGAILTGIETRPTIAWTSTGLTSITSTLGSELGGNGFFDATPSTNWTSAITSTNLQDVTLFKRKSIAGDALQMTLVSNQTLSTNSITAGATEVRACWTVVP